MIDPAFTDLWPYGYFASASRTHASNGATMTWFPAASGFLFPNPAGQTMHALCVR